MSKKLTVAFFIITSFWFLFTFKLTDVPPGINGDEANIGLNSVLIAQTGKDARGSVLPLFSSVPDSFDWKQPVTVYATAVAFKIFGSSYFVLRSISVFFALLSALTLFLLINQIKGFKLALAGLLIFATTPIIMIQSHLALENIAPVPFICLWLLMLYKYHISQKRKYLIFSAASLGLALFSYLGLRLITPTLVLATLLFLYFSSRKQKTKLVLKKLLIFIVALLPFFILLLLARSQYPGVILGLFRPYNLSSYQDVFLPYISSFDPSFLFITGDVTPYHSTGKHGVFLLASLPLFVLGIIRIIQKRDLFLSFVLVSFFLVPLFFGLGSTIHRGSRLLSLVPLFVVVATIGFEYILAFKNMLLKTFSILLVIFLIILNYGDFLNDYWYHYPQRVKQEFAAPVHKAFESLKQLSDENNLQPFIQNDLPLQNPLAFSFFEQAYFPNQLERWKNAALAKNGIIILVDSAGLASLDPSRIMVEKIAGTDYALVTNKYSDEKN